MSLLIPICEHDRKLPMASFLRLFLAAMFEIHLSIMLHSTISEFLSESGRQPMSVLECTVVDCES